MHFIAFVAPAETGGFSVVFPDAPGCVTCGADLAEAEAMAAEALEGWLTVSLDHGDAVRVPALDHPVPAGAHRLLVPVPRELAERLTPR